MIITMILFLPIMDFLFYNKIGVFYSNAIIHHISGIIVNIWGRGTPLILVGSYLSILMFTKSIFLSFINKSNPGLLSLLIFVIAIIIRMPLSVFYFQYFSDIIFAFLVGIVILLNLNVNNYMSKFLNLRFVSQIGILSYSLYIWQQIFTLEQPWSNKFIYSDSVLFNLILLLLVCFISYNFLRKRNFMTN